MKLITDVTLMFSYAKHQMHAKWDESRRQKQYRRRW